MKIAISGTHNSGKTTLCHEVVATLKRAGVQVTMAPEPSRTSRYLAAGLRGLATQMDLFARTIASELEAERTCDVVICDRSLVDVLAYNDSLANDLPHDADLSRAMKEFTQTYMQTYEIIFKPAWKYDMTHSADELRIGDEQFQAFIDERVKYYLNQFRPDFVTLNDPATGGQEIARRIAALGDMSQETTG